MTYYIVEVEIRTTIRIDEPQEITLSRPEAERQGIAILEDAIQKVPFAVEIIDTEVYDSEKIYDEEEL